MAGGEGGSTGSSVLSSFSGLIWEAGQGGGWRNSHHSEKVGTQAFFSFLMMVACGQGAVADL